MSPDSKGLLVLVLGILFCLFIIFTSYSADHFALPIGYQSEIENTLQFETDIEFIVRDIRYNFGLIEFYLIDSQSSNPLDLSLSCEMFYCMAHNSDI
jgi:hypothetical protein